MLGVSIDRRRWDENPERRRRYLAALAHLSRQDQPVATRSIAEVLGDPRPPGHATAANYAKPAPSCRPATDKSNSGSPAGTAGSARSNAETPSSPPKNSTGPRPSPRPHDRPSANQPKSCDCRYDHRSSHPRPSSDDRRPARNGLSRSRCHISARPYVPRSGRTPLASGPMRGGVAVTWWPGCKVHHHSGPMSTRWGQLLRARGGRFFAPMRRRGRWHR